MANKISKERKEYKAKHQKANYERLSLFISKKKTDVINKLKNVENKTAYIVGLIEKDIYKQWFICGEKITPQTFQSL